MKSQRADKLALPIAASPPSHSDEGRDLRVVLAAGGLSAIVLAVVVLLSARTGVLDIPARPTLFLAALTAGVALLGWAGLQWQWGVRNIAWAALGAYSLIITAAVHYTGGPQTPMPAFYLLVVVAASFVLGQRGANLIAGISVMGYAVLLTLEYAGALPVVSIWRFPFDARDRGLLLVVNWLTVATPVLLTAFMSGALAQRLKQRNQQLLTLERVRTELVEMRVHDLRSPLTVLLGALDLIDMVLGERLNRDHQDLLKSARHSGHSILTMIGDILDIARLEAGHPILNPGPVQLQTMLTDSADQFRALAELGSLSLRVEPGGDLLPVQADAKLIQRVLANLIANAIKHTPSGGSITLAARQGRPGYLTVSVHDTGEGIPLDQQRRIFEKFGQVDKEGAERRGTGLGLTFCKLAVEAYQGEIWVESAPGQGRTFTFTLPLT